MVNRFTEITPSTYTPQSLEELAFVPLMKRKKHDEILAKQQDIISGLAKVDPYDKHFNEGVRLKNELESKIDQTASELATNGFNNDMIGKTISLNREYQNLISPTGIIGQINAEKQNILKINEEYDKLGKEKGWSQETTDYWKNKALKEYNETPIYDKNGRILKYTGPKDIANKVDYTKFLDNLATTAKMSTKEFSEGIAGVGTDINGYHTIIKNSKGWKTGSNNPQVEAAYKTLEKELNDPTSEIYKSMMYERRDPNSLLSSLNTQKGVYKQNMQANESAQDINPFGSGPGKDDTDSVDYEGVNVETADITSNANLLSAMDGSNPFLKSVNVTGSPLTMGTTGSNDVYGGKQQQINKALNSPEYLTLARSVQRTKGIKTSDLRSKEVQDAVKDYLSKNKSVALENRYVDPNINKQASLFASKEVSKDKKATSELIMERAQQGAVEVRDTKGNVIPQDELGKYTFTYSGDMTPKSQIKIFNNPKQNIGARRGLLYDPESKKSFPVYVSRGADDFDTPQYKGMKLINEITRITDSRPGLYHKLNVPDFKRFGIKDFEVKYNKNSDTYNVSYIDNDGTSVDEKPMTDQQFQEYILNTQLH